MFTFLELLPVWYQYTLVGLLGLIIGSFLNVVIYRYHTGKSLNGHSHCLSCGNTLRWYELFPLVSYLFLRGKCRVCGCAIPVRYFLVEFTTAGLFLLMFMQFSFGLPLLLSMLLVSVLMVVAVYDIYHMVIPDELVVTMSVLAVVYYVLEYGFTWNTTAFLSHAGAALGAFLFYGGLWLVSKGRWIGFGDAKLAIPLGFILGAPAVYSFIVFSFWIGAIVSLLILGFTALVRIIKAHYAFGMVVNYSKYFTMKSEVPFAPFMIAAFLLVYMYHVSAIALIASFI